MLIAFSVAVTRNLDLPAIQDLSSHGNSDENQKKIADSLGVTFMFNVVNRIANLFDLQPEWHRWRCTQAIRNLTQRLMAFGLPHQMNLADEFQSVESTSHIDTLLPKFGIESISPIWEKFHRLPSVEFAIYQLMLTAIRYSSQHQQLIQEVNAACKVESQDGSSRSRLPQDIEIWQRLYAAPYKLGGIEWSNSNPDDETQLDMVFWVAILAAIHKLNSVCWQKDGMKAEMDRSRNCNQSNWPCGDAIALEKRKLALIVDGVEQMA